MRWLSIIGGLVTSVALILRWYFSSTQTKLRAFKNDEETRKEFMEFMHRGKNHKNPRWSRSSYLFHARELFFEQLRKNRALRK